MKIKQKQNKTLNILKLINIKPYKKKNNEKYMNNKQIKHFKKIIFILYNKIILNIKNINNKKNKDKNVINFPNSINKLIKEKKIYNKKNNNKKIKKLKYKIINTIKKINKGKFGYCDKCKIKIGIKILEHKPTENLCINCKIISKIKKNINI